MTLRPLGSRIVVHSPADEKTESGLYLSAPPAKYEGKVVGCGPDFKGATVGDTVIFGATRATRKHEDGGLLSIVDAEDVLAVVCR
jgi:co-chaperonin GroES (HSP10)